MIGISGTLEEGKITLNRGYADALFGLGVLPVILAPTLDKSKIEFLAKRLDGAVFAGGGDVLPSRYGDSFCHAENSICEERDEFEFLLFNELYRRKKPILGICRGMQVINVVLGGTLHQNIGGHMKSEHRVSLRGRLSALSQSPCVRVNSFHRQAVKEIGESLEILAVSDDGIVEALGNFDGRYLLGVQFHPEKSFASDLFSRSVIEDFANHCKKTNK